MKATNDSVIEQEAYEQLNQTMPETIKHTIADRMSKVCPGLVPFNTATTWDNKKAPSPGPGSYETDFNYKIEVKGPNTFGTTALRNLSLNRTLKSPFCDSTSINNPGVGQYLKSNKFKKVK